MKNVFRKNITRFSGLLKRHTLIPALLAAGFLFFLPVASLALEFSLDRVTVSAYDQFPGGLKIVTRPVQSEPFVFSLEQGDSLDVALFDIWVSGGETSLDADDEIHQPISTSVDISVITENLSGQVEGETWAEAYIKEVLSDTVINRDGMAYVEWSDPVELVFGPEGDGLLKMTLSPGGFGHNPLPHRLTPGMDEAARIIATMELIQTPYIPGLEPPHPGTDPGTDPQTDPGSGPGPGPGTAPTPEPGTIFLMLIGLIGVLAVRRATHSKLQ